MFTLLYNLLSNPIFIGYLHHSLFKTPLSFKEEQYYLTNKDTDINSRNKLIEHNLKLVAHIAKKYENSLYDYEDLVSIGSIGLIKAIDTYNLKTKTKLSTYASKCIENEILMYLRKNKHTVYNISLDAPVLDEDVCLKDTIVDHTISIEKQIENNDKLNELNTYLNELEPLEYNIILYRFGLNKYPKLTQKLIADKYKISRSYVSRIEKRALTKLYKLFKQNKGKDVR